jgi:3-oxoacyl-[acyl-carrier-protein] synthase-3
MCQAAMKQCLDQANVEVDDLKKIFIHQANKKMDEAIVKRFYRLYKKQFLEDILPMNIEEFGNSSVATVPTLYDLVLKHNYKGHSLIKGDIILFASVGAGMNINAITYQI